MSRNFKIFVESCLQIIEISYILVGLLYNKDDAIKIDRYFVIDDFLKICYNFFGKYVSLFLNGTLI